MRTPILLDFTKALAVKHWTVDEVAKRVCFSENLFPPRFEVREENFFCAGYFIAFGKNISANDVALACKNRNWGFFNSFVGDYFIFAYDNHLKQAFVLTDMTGKFPCYFSFLKDGFVASPDFVEVKNRIPKLTLNLDAVFDFIDWSMYVSPETVISEIHQLPPLTLLTIDIKRLSYRLTPLTNLDSFLARKEPPYQSIVEYTNDFLELLAQLTKERLECLPADMPFAAELSSGFDVTLVCYLLKKLIKTSFPCYSMTAKLMKTDTNVDIMMEFANKHGLKVKLIRQDHIYPFSTKSDLERTAKNPIALGGEDVVHFQKKLGQDGAVIKFTGDGADEVYQSYDLDLMGKFPIQEIFFNTVRKLKFGADKILTPRGIKFLLDKKRFARKKVFSQILSPSLTRFNRLSFLAYWNVGMWSLAPFADPRLVQFARRVPRKNSKFPEKQELWQHRTDIFVPSQFRPKGGAELQSNLFLDKKRNFIVKILSDSVLAKKGLIQTAKIIKDAKEGNMDKYRAWGAHVYLVSVLRLEYFLQHNQVEIPN